jgi:pyruvate,water dikinase
MSRFVGKRYQDFLDNIEAYWYFPLIIAKDSSMADGRAEVSIKPVSGVIDQAGGLAFAIRDWANYLVFRINSLENNAILFEFRNGKRFELISVEIPVACGKWHRLAIETRGQQVLAFVDDRQITSHCLERSLTGSVGLWTKADSLTMFKDLVMQPQDRPTCLLS